MIEVTFTCDLCKKKKGLLQANLDKPDYDEFHLCDLPFLEYTDGERFHGVSSISSMERKLLCLQCREKYIYHISKLINDFNKNLRSFFKVNAKKN